MVEPAVVESEETAFQFERKGYFVTDSELHTAENPVFNLTVALRDSYKPGKAS